MMRCRTILFWCLASGLGLSAPASSTPAGASRIPQPRATAPDFVREVQPILSQYCFGCHGEKRKGDLDLRIYTDEKLAAANRPLFQKLATKLAAHEMPPEHRPQPSAEERHVIL